MIAVTDCRLQGNSVFMVVGCSAFSVYKCCNAYGHKLLVKLISNSRENAHLAQDIYC